MTHRHHKTAVVAKMLALILAVAAGQVVGVATAAESPEIFVRKAGLSNTFEIESAKLALTRWPISLLQMRLEMRHLIDLCF